MNTEHIAYAMRNEEARQALIWLNNPAELMHWTMPFIEYLMIAGALLSLLHAISAGKKEQQPAYLLTWLASIFYGLIIEIISYNYVDNFWHGEFSVMLYFNHLPLYIMLLYPAVVYPTFILVKNLKLHQQPYGRIKEACCAAFAAQMFYLPFDNLGPMLHWWVWDTRSLSLQPFWYAVPATSYLWMMTLSAGFALTARWFLWEKAASKKPGTLGWLLAALAVGLVTNIFSVVIQMPTTILGQSFEMFFVCGIIIAAMIMVNASVYATAQHPNTQALPGVLIIFPTLWLFFTATYLLYSSEIFASYPTMISTLDTPVGNIAFTAVALLMIFTLYIKPYLAHKTAR